MLLFSRSCGYLKLHFYEQEWVAVYEGYATLLDVQGGKALVLLFEEFRAPGTNGVLELSIDSVQKAYS